MKFVINRLPFLITLFFMNMFSQANAQIPLHAKDISPLLIGESVPDARLQDKNGSIIALKEVLKQKRTVMVFYRGGWCPFCSLQLSGLTKIEQEIIHLGYQLIAISPDDYTNLVDTENKAHLNYTLYSDPNATFIQAIGIGFSTSAELKTYISSKNNKGKTSEIMPVPTVLVLDTSGKILFEYINPNYKERISEKLLLSVLKIL